MRLTDLDPHWVGAGGEGISSPTGNPCPVCPAGAPNPDCKICFGRGLEYVPAPARHGVGVSFLCPCEKCVAQRSGDPDKDFHLRVYVPFKNPLDGGPINDPDPARPSWQRTGDTFDTLTTQPSILSVEGKGGCGWHGYIGGPGGDRPGEVVTV